jgi:hypothetical protein
MAWPFTAGPRSGRLRGRVARGRASDRGALPAGQPPGGGQVVQGEAAVQEGGCGLGADAADAGDVV